MSDSSATLWIAAHQAPPSMGFSRQESWSGVPLPSLVVDGSGPYALACVELTLLKHGLLGPSPGVSRLEKYYIQNNEFFKNPFCL